MSQKNRNTVLVSERIFKDILRDILHGRDRKRLKTPEKTTSDVYLDVMLFF